MICTTVQTCSTVPLSTNSTPTSGSFLGAEYYNSIPADATGGFAMTRMYVGGVGRSEKNRRCMEIPAKS
jgi:hypothetical protein